MPNTPIPMFFLIFLLFLLMVITRVLPFYCHRFFEHSRAIKKIGQLLPGTIMMLLLFHTLEDVPLTKFPFGLPEIISVLIAIGLFVWTNKFLLALLVSTGFYLFLLYNPFFPIVSG